MIGVANSVSPHCPSSVSYNNCDIAEYFPKCWVGVSKNEFTIRWTYCYVFILFNTETCSCTFAMWSGEHHIIECELLWLFLSFLILFNTETFPCD